MPRHHLHSCLLHLLPAVRSGSLFLLVLLGSPSWAGGSCAAPDLAGDVDVDTTLSGAVFFSENIRVDATLTLEPGTVVTMCTANTAIQVRTGGNLIAEGTSENPIIFQAPNGATEKWRRIFFDTNVGDANRMRHVILNDGGGNDPSIAQAPIMVNDILPGTAASTPVLDHLTINNSGAYGLILLHNESDPTPASVSNVTINDSAAAAIRSEISALSGLAGENQFNGNGSDRIEVLRSNLRIPARWRDHGVPYEVLGSLSLTTAVGEPVEWRLDPGVTLLMPPDASLNINNGSLNAVGTADEPITITRLSDTSGFWNELLFNGDDGDSVMDHVIVEFGGATAGTLTNDEMIFKGMDGRLRISNSTVANSQSNGIGASEGNITIRNSVIRGSGGYGIEVSPFSRTTLRNNEIVNNFAGGVNNSAPSSTCVDAAGNFWGDASGPDDLEADADGCGLASANAGLGDGVSGGVQYRPYRTAGGTAVSDRASIAVSPRFVVANGVFEGLITATVFDGNREPAVGKVVQFETTLGDVVQPALPTDSNGRVTAAITSDTPGFGTLSATNLTDGEPLAALGGVTFWQGPGDTGGLIDPNGSPYASPRLEILRPPFIVGTPMTFNIPMQNTRSVPLDVTVEYGVNRLQVGVPFTPVDEVSRTLAPGESWDAPGFYVPIDTGHRCILATVTFTEAVTGQKVALPSFTLRRNTDTNPCNDFDLGNLVPSRGGVVGVIRHFLDASGEAGKVGRCIQDEVNFRKGGAIDQRYTEVFLPPELTPPVYAEGGDIPTAALADSMTRVSAAAADVSALTTAVSGTRQRLQWAAQAGAIGFVDVQYFQFRRYSAALGAAFIELATQLDQHLLEIAAADIEDVLFTPEDQSELLALLETSGFEQASVDYLLTSGWPGNEIGQRLNETIRFYRGQIPAPATFYGPVRNFRDWARSQGEQLTSQFGTTGAKGLVAAPDLAPAIYEFRVGHSQTGTQTIRLRVKVDSLPLDWTYELADQELTLAEGEVVNSRLTLYPGSSNVAGQTVALSVEGEIDGELTGGITFEYRVPQLLENLAEVFADGFEDR
ncbi:MAG: Ig-like domain-containing protein [Pseudomonadota bacterium]